MSSIWRHFWYALAVVAWRIGDLAPRPAPRKREIMPNSSFDPHHRPPNTPEHKARIRHILDERGARGFWN